MTVKPWLIFGENRAGRQCGSCSFCCVVVPVEDPLDKPANVRCKHLRAKGCSIYSHRPQVCQYWSCVWLFQPEADGLRRPDISGYAVDPMLCEIRLDGRPTDVIQIWVDPGRPVSHRAPELRAYLATQYETRGLISLARVGNDAGDEAILLVPPVLSENGQWLERVSTLLSSGQFRSGASGRANV